MSRPQAAIIVLLACMSVNVGIAGAEDWPAIRGPQGDGHTTLPLGDVAAWPPTRAWEKQVGDGCTSPIIVDGKVYVAGWSGQRGNRRNTTQGSLVLYCFDLADGRELWKTDSPSYYFSRLATGDQNQYGGPSATPTIDPATGYIYTLDTDGLLVCRDTARQGEVVWQKHLREGDLKLDVPQRPDVGGGQRDFGFTASPVIYNDWLLIETGAKQGTLIALDKKTGEKRWLSQYTGNAGHTTGPTIMTVDGRDAAALLALKDLVLIDLQRQPGRTLGTHEWVTDFACNIAAPVAVGDGDLLITSDYNRGTLARLRYQRGKVAAQWQGRGSAVVATPVVIGDRAFAVHNRLKCTTLDNGHDIWQGGSFGQGTLLVAAASTGNDMLITFGNGHLALVDPRADKYTELAAVNGVVKGTCYPQVTPAPGHILCKDRNGHLVVMKLKQ